MPRPHRRRPSPKRLRKRWRSLMLRRTSGRTSPKRRRKSCARLSQRQRLRQRQRLPRRRSPPRKQSLPLRQRSLPLRSLQPPRRNRSLTSPRATSPKNPLNVAITGGIGAGKSEALRAFGRHGAATISSDEIVHELIEDDSEVKRALLERYGTTKRADIAEVVFSDRDELAWLEALLHPRVVKHYLDWRERQTAPLAVTEVPLLYETGGHERFDKVVVITAPKALREARREPLRGDRETRLIDDKEKAKRGGYAHLKNGSLGGVGRVVGAVVGKMVPWGGFSCSLPGPPPPGGR